MAELYIRGKDGRPRLIGKTADPELPGRMAALEERMEALETAPGGVPLSDAVDSASSTTAATSKAVKTAYDAGVAAAAAASSARNAAGTAQEAAEAAKTAADAAQSTANSAKTAAASAASAAQGAQNTADSALKKANAVSKVYVTAAWQSGASWYRKWSDGFIEQGGVVEFATSTKKVTLHVPFADTDYSVVASKHQVNAETGYTPTNGPVAISMRTKTTFTAGTGAEWVSDKFVMWYAAGRS